MSGKEDTGCQSSMPAHAPAITGNDKDRVRESWEWFISEENLSNNGVLIFVKMFELAPKTMGLFDFIGDASSEQALLGNESLLKHGRRVTEVISVVVCRLDDAKVTKKTLMGVGRRHYAYGVKPEFLPAMMQGVMFALRRTLGIRFTPEHEASWQAVLNLMEYVFIKGLTGKESKEEA